MGSEDDHKPIYSSRSDDPAMAAPIDGFVVGLGDRIDELQDAYSHGELGAVGDLAAGLATDAVALGFDPLASCATVVESTGRGGDVDEAHSWIVQLTDLARRIRLGHRGAA